MHNKYKNHFLIMVKKSSLLMFLTVIIVVASILVVLCEVCSSSFSLQLTSVALVVGGIASFISICCLDKLSFLYNDKNFYLIKTTDEVRIYRVDNNDDRMCVYSMGFIAKKFKSPYYYDYQILSLMRQGVEQKQQMDMLIFNSISKNNNVIRLS